MTLAILKSGCSGPYSLQSCPVVSWNYIPPHFFLLPSHKLKSQTKSHGLNMRQWYNVSPWSLSSLSPTHTNGYGTHETWVHSLLHPQMDMVPMNPEFTPPHIQMTFHLHRANSGVFISVRSLCAPPRMWEEPLSSRIIGCSLRHGILCLSCDP